jgi:rRNA-processing protein FCF1
MRDKFPGYFKPTETDTQVVWDAGFFVFDTNVILNLYRYSVGTSDDFLKAIESLKNRLFVPHQVAEEFLKNRLTVIDQQTEEYNNFESDLNRVMLALKNQKGHPFVSEATLKKLNESIENVKEEVKKTKMKWKADTR